MQFVMGICCINFATMAHLASVNLCGILAALCLKTAFSCSVSIK